jgi:hypothetical protein
MPGRRIVTRLLLVAGLSAWLPVATAASQPFTPGRYSLAGMLERREAVAADRTAALAPRRQSAERKWDRAADAAAAVHPLEVVGRLEAVGR